MSEPGGAAATAWLWVSVLTQDTAGGLENGAALPQPHGPAHLPRVVLRHVNHLWTHTHSQTWGTRLRSAQRSGQALRTTGCWDSGSNSVELASGRERTETSEKILFQHSPTKERRSDLTFPAQLVSGKLAHGQLHPETNACTHTHTHTSLVAVTDDDARTDVLTEERLLLLPGPADGVNLPFRSSDAEASRNQDAAEGRGGTRTHQRAVALATNRGGGGAQHSL